MDVLWACLLASVLTGCSLTSSPYHPTTLVTRSSFAGIHLFESQAAVEAIYGHGHPVKRHEPGLIDYAAGFTVGYQKLPRLARGVAIVYTTSRRFRTAEGVGVGSTLAAVEGFGHMDCGPTT